MGKGKGKAFFKGVGSFVKGLIWKQNPAIGAVIGIAKGTFNQVKDHAKKNVESEVGGVGGIDWAGLAGSILGGAAVIYGLYLVANGTITMDQFIEFFTGKG